MPAALARSASSAPTALAAATLPPVLCCSRNVLLRLSTASIVPRIVVDELRVDVAEAPEDGQPRPRRRAAQVAPQAVVALVARAPPVPGDHFAPAFLPT